MNDTANPFDLQREAGECPRCRAPAGRWRFSPRSEWTQSHCEACEEILQATAELERSTRNRERDDAAQRERSARATRLLDVRPKYATATLGTFQIHGDADARAKQARMLQVARRYLGQWPRVEPVLVFQGSPGTGKGHIAWALARELAATAGVMARVVKLADLVRRLRATWRGQGDEEEVLASYRDLDLLVIDEVSSHAFYGQSVHQHLYDVIDHRIEFERPTIVTSNETDAGLQAILRPALWDRLHDGGGILDFGAASWRSRPEPSVVALHPDTVQALPKGAA